MCVVYQIVTVDVQGRSTLVIAAAHGNECAMDMLLKAGSNVNHRCKVLFACTHSGISYLTLLLEWHHCLACVLSHGAP